MRKIGSATLQKLIIDIAKGLNPDKEYTQSNLYVKKFADGSIHIIDADYDVDLGAINETDINVPTQVGAPEKRAAAKEAKALKPSKGKTGASGL